MTNLLRPEPVVVLTDYDLDGAGASVLLDYCYNVAGRRQQGLKKVRAAMETVRAEYVNINTLVVADLCLLPEDLQWALENYDHVVYYDHHEESARYVELAKAIPDRLTVHFDLEYCSAALVYRSYVLDGPNDQIDGLSELVCGVSAFDLWKTDSAYFKRGLIMNDIFWNLHMQGFRERFANGWAGFTDSEKTFHEAKMSAIDAVFERAMVDELESGSKIVMIDDPDAINYVTMMMEGDVFYVLYQNRGNDGIQLSCRTDRGNTKVNFNIAIQELLGCPDTQKVVEAGGGHATAAGVRFKEGITPNEMADWIASSLDVRVRHW